jgi:hypothetical protein
MRRRPYDFWSGFVMRMLFDFTVCFMWLSLDRVSKAAFYIHSLQNGRHPPSKRFHTPQPS